MWGEWIGSEGVRRPPWRFTSRRQHGRSLPCAARHRPHVAGAAEVRGTRVFITSPGYIDGPGARREAGLDWQGPNLVISTMGVFAFDTADGGETGTCEMELVKTFSGIPPEVIGSLITWPLRVRPDCGECAPPTADELALVRRLDPGPIYLREGRY